MISVDEQVIEEAYRNQLKKLFDFFCLNVEDGIEEPGKRFAEGLKVARLVRQLAINAVRQQ